MGSRRQGLLLAPLLPPPARSQFREPRRPPRPPRDDALLARQGIRRVPLRCGAVPLRARGHQLREPAGDARVPPRGAPARRRTLPGAHPPGRSQSVASRRPALFRRRGRIPHGVSLPAHASYLPRRPPGRSAAHHGHLPPHAGDPTGLPVVPVPPEPRRADARDGERGGAAASLPRLRLGPPHAAQPRHTAAPRAAAGQ